MYLKSALAFHPVCGGRLAFCSVLKNWLENVKQEVQKFIHLVMASDLTLVLLTCIIWEAAAASHVGLEWTAATGTARSEYALHIALSLSLVFLLSLPLFLRT